MIEPNRYVDIIKDTTLVSADLLVINEERILLGRRLNEPAKDYLFNPGARIYKYETEEEALIRVAKTEVGLDLIEENNNNKYKYKIDFLGNYNHTYNNNFKNNRFGTHYLTHAYIIHLSNNDLYDISINHDNQHEYLEWYDIKQALKNDEVHPFVKWFLRDYLHKQEPEQKQRQKQTQDVGIQTDISSTDTLSIDTETNILSSSNTNTDTNTNTNINRHQNNEYIDIIDFSISNLSLVLAVAAAAWIFFK
jgi:colanic acid biosynthesis protein WcaH